MKSVAFTIACVLATAAPAAAQTSSADPGDVLARAATNNWYLRAVVANDDTIAGRVHVFRDRYRIGEEWIEPSIIVRLDRRDQIGNRAGLTGVVLGLAGAAIGATIDDSDSDPPRIISIALFGSMFALVGVYAGDALFPGRIEWQPVWP